MKRILALIMALAMVFVLAACNNGTETDTSTTTEAPVESGEPVDGSNVDPSATVDPTGDSNVDPSATVDPTGDSNVDPSNVDPNGTLSAAQLVSLINTATKASSYSVNRNCKIVKNIDVGGATGTLNNIIKAIDENSDLDSVVGGFIGVGSTTGKMPANSGDINNNYKMKAASLGANDIKITGASNGVYTFTIASIANPKKNNSSPFSRFTNDFITHEEVVSSIAEFTGAIKVKESNVSYKNIKGEATVVNGKITTLKYSYDFDATLKLSVVVNITGNGSASTTGVYSNIVY